MASKHDIRSLIDGLQNRGFIVRKTNGGHYRMTNTQTGKFGFIPSTPSDYRSILNAKALAKRLCIVSAIQPKSDNPSFYNL